jgi:hypothetical protein
MSDTDVTLPTTLPLVPFAKLAYGITENSAYAAARRKEIPTIRVGLLLRVPVRVALAKIAGGDPEILQCITSDFAAKLKLLEQAAEVCS